MQSSEQPLEWSWALSSALSVTRAEVETLLRCQGPLKTLSQSMRVPPIANFIVLLEHRWHRLAAMDLVKGVSEGGQLMLHSYGVVSPSSLSPQIFASYAHQDQLEMVQQLAQRMGSGSSPLMLTRQQVVNTMLMLANYIKIEDILQHSTAPLGFQRMQQLAACVQAASGPAPTDLLQHVMQLPIMHPQQHSSIPAAVPTAASLMMSAQQASSIPVAAPTQQQPPAAHSAQLHHHRHHPEMQQPSQQRYIIPPAAPTQQPAAAATHHQPLTQHPHHHRAASQATQQPSPAAAVHHQIPNINTLTVDIPQCPTTTTTSSTPQLTTPAAAPLDASTPAGASAIATLLSLIAASPLPAASQPRHPQAPAQPAASQPCRPTPNSITADADAETIHSASHHTNCAQPPAASQPAAGQPGRPLPHTITADADADAETIHTHSSQPPAASQAHTTRPSSPTPDADAEAFQLLQHIFSPPRAEPSSHTDTQDHVNSPPDTTTSPSSPNKQPRKRSRSQSRECKQHKKKQKKEKKHKKDKKHKRKDLKRKHSKHSSKDRPSTAPPPSPQHHHPAPLAGRLHPPADIQHPPAEHHHPDDHPHPPPPQLLPGWQGSQEVADAVQQLCSKQPLFQQHFADSKAYILDIMHRMELRNQRPHLLLALHHLSSTPIPNNCPVATHIARTLEVVAQFFSVRAGRRFTFHELEDSLSRHRFPLMFTVWDGYSEDVALIEEMFREGIWKPGDIGPAHLAMLYRTVRPGLQSTRVLQSIRQACLTKSRSSLNSGVFVVKLLQCRGKYSR